MRFRRHSFARENTLQDDERDSQSNASSAASVAEHVFQSAPYYSHGAYSCEHALQSATNNMASRESSGRVLLGSISTGLALARKDETTEHLRFESVLSQRASSRLLAFVFAFNGMRNKESGYISYISLCWKRAFMRTKYTFNAPRMLALSARTTSGIRKS